MPPTQPPPPKKDVALALLERSNDHGIYVHLDPRRDGVAVPAWFKKQPQLVLQIGLNMAIPIPDLRLDDDGMVCTLSFNRAPFYCVVPWTSVFAIMGDDFKGMVWPDDMPSEIARQAQVRPIDGGQRKEPKPQAAGQASQGKGNGPKAAKRPRKRPVLAAVDESPAPAKAASPRRVAQPAPAQIAPSPPSKPAAGGSRKKRELPPYLRVVK
jgi:stringent starvation protein B